MSTPQTARSAVDHSLKSCKDQPGPLLPVLHAVQNELGWIPPETVPWIAEGLNLSRAEVHGVVSFYHYFRSSPPGRHVVRVCRAEACQAMGGNSLERLVKSKLGIDFGQTTADGRFTLEAVYCLGNCACAPAVDVDDRLYGRVTEQWLTDQLTTQGEDL